MESTQPGQGTEEKQGLSLEAILMIARHHPKSAIQERAWKKAIAMQRGNKYYRSDIPLDKLAKDESLPLSIRTYAHQQWVEVVKEEIQSERIYWISEDPHMSDTRLPIEVRILAGKKYVDYNTSRGAFSDLIRYVIESSTVPGSGIPEATRLYAQAHLGEAGAIAVRNHVESGKESDYSELESWMRYSNVPDCIKEHAGKALLEKYSGDAVQAETLADSARPYHRIEELLTGKDIPETIHQLSYQTMEKLGKVFVEMFSSTGNYDDLARMMDNTSLPEEMRELAKQQLPQCVQKEIEEAYESGNAYPLRCIIHHAKIPDNLKKLAEEKMAGTIDRHMQQLTQKGQYGELCKLGEDATLPPAKKCELYETIRKLSVELAGKLE